MQRRNFLKLGGAALGSAAIGRPALVRAETASTLRFVPYSDLAILDPIISTNYVTRCFAQVVFDTLYGMDEQLRAQPQMVADHTVENDGKLWKLTLRDGLVFHDGTPVLARDVVASLTRWGKRDALGSALFAATDECSAPSDKIVQFRLSRPFPMLPEALGKPTSFIPVIMPERLAQASPFTPVTEVIGSGPYQFMPGERVPGSLNVFKRFERYKPRDSGMPSFTAGPRIAYFERIEWRTMPDGGTASAALRQGEIDWWEQPNIDLMPLLAKDRNIKVDVVETRGLIGQIRLNHLLPPFDNPAICHALLGAIDQNQMMEAVAGGESSVKRGPVGVFAAGSPSDSTAGMEVLTGKRDLGKVKRDLEAAGYKGEKVVLLSGTDVPRINAICEVMADTCRQIGMNIDYVATDWGTVNQRMLSQKPVDQGGWNMFGIFSGGLDHISPAYHNAIRGNGVKGVPMWTKDDMLEDLRSAWFVAQPGEAQNTIAAKIQARVFEIGAFLPVGQFFPPTAYRKDLTNMLSGLPLFTNVRRG